MDIDESLIEDNVKAIVYKVIFIVRWRGWSTIDRLSANISTTGSFPVNTEVLVDNLDLAWEGMMMSIDPTNFLAKTYLLELKLSMPPRSNRPICALPESMHDENLVVGYLIEKLTGNA